MTAEVDAGLPVDGFPDHHADGAQVFKDRGFLVVTTTEQAQRAAFKFLDHHPTELQPQPTVAGVA